MCQRFFLGLTSCCFSHRFMLRSLAFFSSHCFTATSMAPLRSPFFPPNTVTTASLSFLSVSSLRTMYILPKVRHRDLDCFPYNAFFLDTVLYRYKRLNFFAGIISCQIDFVSVWKEWASVARLDRFLERA